MYVTLHPGTYSIARNHRNSPFRLANVISPDHRRYLNNLYLTKEVDRLASFGRFPVSQRNITPTELARAGFFYLGDSDRTQCFSCFGVLRNWSYEDSAVEEHQVHFPNCRMVLGTEELNIRIPQVEETFADRQHNYPCQYPSNPHMRNKEARLATFDRRWPTGAVRASPAELAQAGFFFLGERDRVKCFYCNGGLQNWEYEDSPWIEHAKWFPTCQYLQQKQGTQFVYRHLSMYPHLNRPIIARQEGSPLVADQRQLDTNLPARRSRTSPEIIDPREELRKRNEKVFRILATSEAVSTVKGMGFEQSIIREVIADSIGEEGNEVCESAVKLLEAVMAHQEQLSAINSRSSSLQLLDQSLLTVMETEGKGSNEDKSALSNISAPGFTQIQPVCDDTARLQVNEVKIKEKLEKLVEEQQCKVCFSEEANVVFIPCSHMCCCLECTKSLRNCPICRKGIEKAMKTYRS